MLRMNRLALRQMLLREPGEMPTNRANDGFNIDKFAFMNVF